MSLKYAAQQVAPNHYVLPKVGDMKVEAHAFLSEGLYATTDEGLWQQIANGASYEGVIGAYLMPDCLSEDTEVLTTEGFITLRNLTPGHEVANVDPITGCVHFSKPTAVFVRDLREGEVVYEHRVEAFRSTVITTAGHRNAYRSEMGIRSDALPNETVLCDYVWGGTGLLRPTGALEVPDLLLRLAVWTVGDGSIKVTDNVTSKNYRVRFGFRKKRKIERVTELLAAAGLDFTTSMSDKQTEIYVSTASSKVLLDIVGDKKRLPFKLIAELSVDQARTVLEEALLVDGDFENHRKGGAWLLHSNDIAPLDFYSALVAVNFGCANLRHRDVETNFSKGAPTRSYRMTVIENSKTQVSRNGLHRRKISKTSVPYFGKVGCLCCDTGFFIARRDGLTFVTGNCHLGYGVPVGSVVVTENTIIQSGSGYDISCGVLYMRVPGLTASSVQSKERRWRWVNEVEKRIATGKGAQRPALAPTFNARKLDEVLRYGVKALGVSADLCERQYIPVQDGTDLTKIVKARDKAVPQMGSVGGGNHFIELQCDEATGDVWVMVHCGSRGYGWQTADYFFYHGGQLRGLPVGRREEAWLRADEPLGREYWAHHNSAANYAVANRHTIVHGIQEALEEVFNVRGEVYYEISHNLVQEETLILPDGSQKKGFVHRKGATRAFPAGHPELVGTRWEATGHPCLIPGSMFAGAAILFASEGAKHSGYSVNHGSGRLLSRGKAKTQLAHRQEKIDETMATVVRTLGGVQVEGIVCNTKKTPLDECDEVYKDLDEVLAVLEANGIAKVHHRLYPVANIKGTD